MVAGPEAGVSLAERHELDALFLLRDDAGGVRAQPVDRLFSSWRASPPHFGGQPEIARSLWFAGVLSPPSLRS
jgi:hypothetical protein